MYDIVIIGAGIIGSFLAHDLSKFELRTAVIEKESDVANRATMANSAIIHSGHDPKEGTLKAKLNVLGNRMYEEICKEISVGFKRTSAFVAATSSAEEIILAQLYEQARGRGIPAEILSREEALLKEPNLSDSVAKVIELPTTGIINPWETAIALMEESVLNGVDLFLNSPVCQICRTEDGYQIQTNKKIVETKIIINAAGVYADDIYRMISADVPYHITPRRGEYYVLDKRKASLISRVIYPVPSEAGKGVLVVPTIHGNILLGPNSEFIQDKEGNNNTAEHLEYVKKAMQKTVKNIPLGSVIRTFAGLRPSGNTHDFVIEEAKEAKNFINAACIESPGLASAPAISRYILTELLRGKVEFREKIQYQRRRPWLDMKKMTSEQQNKLVRENPAYGHMVCRCEQITEGEIIDSINRPVGAKTVKGVKKRVRPGTGRCQGGFCEPLVVKILARELHISPLEVMFDQENSYLFSGETKENLQSESECSGRISDETV